MLISAHVALIATAALAISMDVFVTVKDKTGWIEMFSNVAMCQFFTNSNRIKLIWKTNYCSIDW